MNKLILAGLFVATGFAGLAAAAPASAAPFSGSVPSCSSSTDINQNVDQIRLQLRGAGYDVNQVEEWNGCVRAYVENANGAGEHTAYFDPDTLELITTTGIDASNNAQG
jgi:Peptidase propeptide and YPEB domain